MFKFCGSVHKIWGSSNHASFRSLNGHFSRTEAITVLKIGKWWSIWAMYPGKLFNFRMAPWRLNFDHTHIYSYFQIVASSVGSSLNRANKDKHVIYDYNVPSFSPHVPGLILCSTSQNNPPLAQGLQELRRTPFVDELGLRDRGSDCCVSAQRGKPNDAPTIWGWCLHISQMTQLTINGLSKMCQNHPHIDGMVSDWAT